MLVYLLLGISQTTKNDRVLEFSYKFTLWKLLHLFPSSISELSNKVSNFKISTLFLLNYQVNGLAALELLVGLINMNALNNNVASLWIWNVIVTLSPFHLILSYSLRMYNSLVERCFTDCVDTFRRKTLDKQEETCVRRCAEKFLKHSMRVGMRFAELNQGAATPD